MVFSKHLILFIKNNLVQLRRKWLTLPLLLLFPIAMIGLIITIIITLFIPPENEPIQIGVVDLDQSEETTVIINMITESPDLGEFIKINSMSESEAVRKIDQDQISTYITFPKNFTNHLYEGDSVSLSIIGNPNQATDSFLIKEFLDSITRLISAAQANILTINHYAKELEMDMDERHDMLFDQFVDFLLYTVGKDKIIDQEKITNHATSSPIHYYSLASWFIIVMIWLLLVYNFLYKEETIRMKERMKLYGVTEMQQLFARMFVTLIFILPFAVGGLAILQHLLEIPLDQEDYLRIMIVLFIHSGLFLQCLAIIETIILSAKIRLLGQSLLTFLLIMTSGTIIPSIYFPLQIQKILPYVFSNEGFHWLQEVILNERFYVDYYPLLFMSLTSLFFLIGCSLWKERVES